MRFTYHFKAYRHVSHGIKLVLLKVSHRLPFHVLFPLATVKNERVLRCGRWRRIDNPILCTRDIIITRVREMIRFTRVKHRHVVWYARWAHIWTRSIEAGFGSCRIKPPQRNDRSIYLHTSPDSVKYSLQKVNFVKHSKFSEL